MTLWALHFSWPLTSLTLTWSSEWPLPSQCEFHSMAHVGLPSRLIIWFTQCPTHIGYTFHRIPTVALRSKREKINMFYAEDTNKATGFLGRLCKHESWDPWAFSVFSATKTKSSKETKGRASDVRGTRRRNKDSPRSVERLEDPEHPASMGMSHHAESCPEQSWSSHLWGLGSDVGEA